MQYRRKMNPAWIEVITTWGFMGSPTSCQQVSRVLPQIYWTDKCVYSSSLRWLTCYLSLLIAWVDSWHLLKSELTIVVFLCWSSWHSIYLTEKSVPAWVGPSPWWLNYELDKQHCCPVFRCLYNELILTWNSRCFTNDLNSSLNVFSMLFT